MNTVKNPIRIMHITKVNIVNYRAIQGLTIAFNPGKNIIVGNNEAGKSTLLEAINLALTGQLNGRSILYELHPFLFNATTVAKYVADLHAGKNVEPPYILIEVYLDDDQELAIRKGRNNSAKENVPGLYLRVELNETFQAEYAAFVSDPKKVRNIPIEYYRSIWRDFADHELVPKTRPVRSLLIDASGIRSQEAPNKYIMEIVESTLDVKERASLSLSFRKMKDDFLDDEAITAINKKLSEKKGHVSEKVISVSLDTSAKGSWESGVVTHLDAIPFPLVGKGEQSSIKIQLAMDAAAKTNIFLVEEPENHLSHANLNKLTNRLNGHADGRQLLITTHNSFVLNKLGIENVILFNGQNSITLSKLDAETRDYFLKLPGYDTLRMILAEKVILVEGPSDELVVQKAYFQKHGKLPLEDGVDVISVGSLAFKRFLEIAVLLKIPTRVVTDNDGDLDALQTKYAAFNGADTVKICYDSDVNFQTLEPQLLKANGFDPLKKVLGSKHLTEEALLKYMKGNKTEVALAIFNSVEAFTVPQYILDAIQK